MYRWLLINDFIYFTGKFVKKKYKERAQEKEKNKWYSMEKDSTRFITTTRSYRTTLPYYFFISLLLLLLRWKYLAICIVTWESDKEIWFDISIYQNDIFVRSLLLNGNRSFGWLVIAPITESRWCTSTSRMHH